MQLANQEIHLWPTTPGLVPPPAAQPAPMRLPPEPSVLQGPGDALLPCPGPLAHVATPGVLLEPFANARKQSRLFARFPNSAAAQVNGEPAPRLVVLAPGDDLQWDPGLGFRVALLNKPQIGPPPASVLGKSCPVCRVPFAATATTVTCQCGVVLHCEPAAGDLQCAQMRRECPVCKRPIVLTEGYVDPPSHED